jgi:hypothetical protein
MECPRYPSFQWCFCRNQSDSHWQQRSSNSVQLTGDRTASCADSRWGAAEGVRLGPDTFLVQDNTCAVTTNQSASAIADLGVDELIGGVTRAVPDATKAVINGEEVWRYSFNRDDLRLTNIEIAQDGRILDAQGELWFSPAREAAIRFYLSMDVENAYVFGSQLAVTGQAIMQYDLSGIGSEQNISVPFGC